MKNRLLLFTLTLATIVTANNHNFRKYAHVKKFYADITLETIQVAREHNLPAAAVLALAGLESGYGRGYVSQITGNILSLGAFKRDKELPALYLPYSKSKKMILFDPKVIQMQDKSDLTYKLRAKSLKRDYRPEPYAGNKKNLALLKYNSHLRQQARKACLNDFATRWISLSSNKKVFKNARVWLNALIDKKGKEILFNMNANNAFVDKIGGLPHSFNYRKTWPIKVKIIMKKVALVRLVNDIVKNKMSFNEAWERE